MLRRDFLRRMAFAAIASGVLGRVTAPQPKRKRVEWCHMSERDVATYADGQRMSPRTIIERSMDGGDTWEFVADVASDVHSATV